jgi:hypothetical protein
LSNISSFLAGDDDPIPTLLALIYNLLFAKIVEYPAPPASLKYNTGGSAIELLITIPLSPVVCSTVKFPSVDVPILTLPILLILNLSVNPTAVVEV